MTTLPFASWAPDVAGLNSKFTADVLNVLCSAAGYIPFPQMAEFSDALAATPTGGFTATDDDGTKYIFAGTAAKLYLLDNTDLSWIEVSQLAADQTTNGTFATDTGWTKSTGWTISGGTAVATAAANTSLLTQSQGFTADAVYKVTYTISGYTEGNVRAILTGGTNVLGAIRQANGTFTEYLTAVTGNNAFNFQTGGTSTTLNIDNVTVQKQSDYSSTTTERWRFAQYGQYVVAVNAADNPQVYQLGVDSAFSDLGGSPPKARFVSVCGDFLFLSGLTDHPNRVQWSALNDITGWTPGTDSSDFQDFAYGEMVMGVTPSTNPIIIHKHAITLGTFVPGSDVIFTFQKVTDARGAAAPYSITTKGYRTFFADAGGFYMIGQDGAEIPIGKEKVDRTVFTTIDGATLYDIVGEVDPFYSRVYFAVRYASTTTAFDRLIVYDWELQRWTQFGGEVGILFPLASGTIGYTLDNLTDLTSYSLDDLPFSLDSQVWQGGSPVMAAFNANDKLCFFAGMTSEATITTQETGNTDGSLSYLDGASIIADTNDVHLSVGTRMRRGDSVAYGAEFSPTPASDRVDFRSCSRFHTFKMRIDAGSSWSMAQGLDVSPKPAGRR